MSTPEIVGDDIDQDCQEHPGLAREANPRARPSRARGPAPQNPGTGWTTPYARTLQGA